MQTSKNIMTRLRLGKHIDFSDDFRKRFLNNEYGNYEKYEKNEVKTETDRGEEDTG
jgi:hypothetical protein